MNVTTKLTTKFRNATYSIRDELLPIDTWLLLTEKDKPSKSKGEINNPLSSKSSTVDNKTQQQLEQQQAILDSLSIISTTTTTTTTTTTMKHKQQVDYYNSTTTTQLHQLCSMSSSNVDMIQIILSSSPMAARCRDKSGNLPLHVLLCQEDPHPPSVLVVLQANSAAARVRSANAGCLPLFQACRLPKAHPSIIKMLLQSYPEAIDCKTFGSTPLHTLTHAGNTNVESIRALLTMKPDLAKQVNNTGNLPLHYVAANVESVGSAECVRLLLSVYPEGAGHPNKTGQTPAQRVQLRWDHSQNLSEVTLSLRLLLRHVTSFRGKGSVAPFYKTETHSSERSDLAQLNWLYRKDIVMARHMARLKQENTMMEHDVATEKQASVSTVALVTQDALVFATIVLQLNCEEVWRHIVSYL